jgi:UDP-glucose 4-epimerase
MKVLVTGSAGRVGRAIVERLRSGGDTVVALDVKPGPHADLVADVADREAMRRAVEGKDAVVHVAALHAPHVGIRGDADFQAINVDATAMLVELARTAGIQRFVFTSTTALYGSAAGAGGIATWVDEGTDPAPRTIYHRTKIAAEKALEEAAGKGGLALTILRMSRCFPESASWMAACRLHRGVDARDVAEAHALALESGQPGVRRYVISGATPFRREDARALMSHAPLVIARREPALAAAFARRGWELPAAIDRVYDPALARRELGWTPRYGFEEVLAQLDAGSPEVLPT